MTERARQSAPMFAPGANRPVGVGLGLGVCTALLCLLASIGPSETYQVSTSTASSNSNTSSEDAKFQQQQQQNGFHLHSESASQNELVFEEPPAALAKSTSAPGALRADDSASSGGPGDPIECPASGLLTFEISTGFIYKPGQQRETLAMMPSTLQLTDCLDYCLHNQSCLAINFEMGLCVLLAASANRNPQNLYTSQFPVFTIYAEKKCLLANVQASKQFNQGTRRFRCQRAWTFERVAGFEMKLKARRQLQLASRELCMDACLLERGFECRSANWHRKSGLCALSDQDRHSVSQSEAGDQRVASSLLDFYGPSNLTAAAAGRHQLTGNHHHAQLDQARLGRARPWPTGRRRLLANAATVEGEESNAELALSYSSLAATSAAAAANQAPVAEASVDYLENNCVFEPNKLCEFRKIQNRVLKTVDSIYQDVASLDECKQKCLAAPYRCYSFDYGDTSERVCRTSHLDQASLLSVREPYLDVVGAITYELAGCFNVTVQCRAKEMVASVAASKSFRGKIYAKSRPSSCVNDVQGALQFKLSMRYHDDACDVRSSSANQLGVFSQDIVIQHHDRIVTTQDVGLSVYCQYDLGNRSVTNQVDLAIERIPDQFESKQQAGAAPPATSQTGPGAAPSTLTITGLATTVVKSPNVTMRITNMSGQPVANATVGDRLALLFEIQEKTSPFGIFVRNIVAMDGKQLMQEAAGLAANQSAAATAAPNGVYHYASQQRPSESLVEALLQQNGAGANSIQFIDSDGCPTDANLMGPLVKMDPSGHRLLAPFDAFKFPTSDMVFFRAVVTSCLAECGPAVCPPQAPPLANGNNIGDTEPPAPAYSTQTTTELTTLASGRPSPPASTHSAADDAEIHPAATAFLTTRTMTTTTTGGGGGGGGGGTTSAAPEPQYVVAIATTAAAATEVADQRDEFTTKSPPPQAADNQQRLAAQTSLAAAEFTRTSPGVAAHANPTTTEDSMTIVPGFASSKSLPDQPADGAQASTLAPPTTQSASWSSETTKMMDSLAAEVQQLMVNMTNNHAGRPPPRPATVGAGEQLGAQTAAANNPIGMSKEQKLELVKLFETKLKQQQFAQPSVANANLSELSDLYTGFLSSLMLNELGQQQQQQRPDPTSPAAAVAAGSLLAPLANSINYKKQVDQQQLNAIEQQPRPQSGADLVADGAPANLADLIRALEFVYETNRNNVRIQQDAANYIGELRDRIVHKRRQDDQPRATGSHHDHQQQQQQQQPPNSVLEPLGSRATIGKLEGRHNNKAVHPATLARQQQQSQNESRMQKKRDMANRQALADSYLGAFQSFGKLRARRRRKRETIGDSLTSVVLSAATAPRQLLSSDHIYMEQEQSHHQADVARPTTGAPSSRGGSQTTPCDKHRVFKRAIVEMYHTHRFDGQQHARIKRHAQTAASPLAQAKPDAEELVVQSIKIVDRLHFEDEQRPEEQPQPRLAARDLPPKAMSAFRSRPTSGAIRNDLSAPARELDAGMDQNSLGHGRGFGLSALGVFLVSLCFIFVQLSMVLVYLIGWTRRRRRGDAPVGRAVGWPVQFVPASFN